MYQWWCESATELGPGKLSICDLRSVDIVPCEQLNAVISGLSRIRAGGVLSSMSDDHCPIPCTFCAVANTALERRRRHEEQLRP